MKFTCYLAGHGEPITKNSPFWDSPLPTGRRPDFSIDPFAITLGEYFKAAEHFLLETDMKVLLHALSHGKEFPVFLEQIDAVSIYSEKHGEFYHPARVEVFLDDHQYPFVLNVAVSDVGKRYILDEFLRIERLNRQTGCNFLPLVFGFGKAPIPGKDIEVEMFLGQWFDGYFEFHLSGDSSSVKKPVIVWDPEGGNYFLPEEKKYQLYKEAARILTCYYDLVSFAQIYPWHHAAGDFILRLESDTLSLRLVTARGYKPLLENDDSEPGTILQALALFLLNLSVSNRMDRLDGVGEMAWSDPIAVKATIDGFFQELFKKPDLDDMAGSVFDFFKIYIGSFSRTVLFELFEEILNSYPPHTARFRVMRANIREHAICFHESIKEFLEENNGMIKRPRGVDY